jgi:cytochrome c oxidase assembly protein Cox11
MCRRAFLRVPRLACVQFTGATHAKDWIGIYKIGHVPGKQSSHSWSYHSSAVKGSGTVKVTPKEPGKYYLVMFCCDGYKELTGRIPLVVAKKAAAHTIKILTKAPYVAGAPIAVQFTGATHAKDWVGMYTKGHTPGKQSSHSWSHSVKGTGTVMITPKTAGTYFIVMFCCDGYTETTKRIVGITVKAKPVVAYKSTVKIASNGPFVAGSAMTIAFTGATHAKDWIGLYKVGHTPGKQSSHSWSYHGAVKGSGSVKVTPKVPGNYYLVMFCCGGYKEVSKRIGPINVQVKSNTKHSIKVAAGPYGKGQKIKVTFSGAVDSKDWVGMYKLGDVPGKTSSHSWAYHGKTVKGSGSVILTPKDSGSYFIAMFCCDKYTEVTPRTTIYVGPPLACLASKKDSDGDGYPDCADSCPKQKDVNAATLKRIKNLKGSIKTSLPSYSGSYLPAKAIDTSKSSYWCSKANTGPVTMTIDLGQAVSVSGLQIRWAYWAKSITIRTSTNGKSYKTAWTGKSKVNGELTNAMILSTAARYVTITMARGAKYIGIRNLEIHTCKLPTALTCVAGVSKDSDGDGYPDCADACPSKKDVNLATMPRISANKGSIKSSVAVWSSTYPATKAIDGTTGYWCTKSNVRTATLTLDLGKAAAINGVEIKWVYWAKSFDILLSTNGKSYTKVFTGMASARGQVSNAIIKKAVTARYVKVVMTAGTTYAGKPLLGVTYLQVHTCKAPASNACLPGVSKDSDGDGYPDCMDACPKKKDVNVARQGQLSATNMYSASYSAIKAIDASPTSYWCSKANTAPVTMTLKLKALKSVSGVEISWAYFAKNIDIYLSTDGKSYGKVWSGTSKANKEVTNAVFKSALKARYVRIRMVRGAKYLGIYNLEVHSCN